MFQKPLKIPLNSLRRPIVVTLANAAKEEGNSFHFDDLGTAWLSPFLKEHALTGENQKKVAGRLEISRESDLVRVRGKIEFEPQLECVRSLTVFRTPIRSEIDALFTDVDLTKGSEVGSEAQPIELGESLLVSYEFSNGNVVLDELLLDTFETALPDFPLCSPECKGLCPACGENLNLNPTCRCQKDSSRNQSNQVLHQ